MCGRHTAVLAYGATGSSAEALAKALTESGFTHTELDKCDAAVVVLDARGEQVLPGLIPMLQQILSKNVKLGTLLLVSVGEEVGAHARAGATRGLRGLVRTLSQECSGADVSLIEFAAREVDLALVEGVIAELHRPGQSSVSQYSDGRRYEIALVDVPWPAVSRRGAGSGGYGESERDALKVGPGRVIVAVGGGRGITSQCIGMLVGDRSPTVYLAGSTPPPEESFLRQFDDCEGKADLVARLASKSSNPLEVEQAARKILAQREILDTVTRLRTTGAIASYHQVDSTNEGSVSAFVRMVVEVESSVDIFVYGAGLTVDRRFEDVSLSDVSQVMNVKVGGLVNYLSSLNDVSCEPATLVAFGSVAASVGNPGQSAYSVANDAMEGVLRNWYESHTNSRAVTINWGPWARDVVHPGMVSPGLDRVFAQRGLDLLQPEDGARAFLTELAWGVSDVHSVTLVPSSWRVQEC